MTNSKKTLVTDIEQIEQTLQMARQQARNLEKAVEEMEQRVKLARGTAQDLTLQAEVAKNATPTVTLPVPKPATVVKPPTLRQRVEGLIRQSSMSVGQLVKHLGVPQAPINDILNKLKEEKAVYNTGTEEYPLWTYVIGDNTPTPEVNRLVRRLVTERPMTLKELVAATGARLSRVSGAVVHLQRTEKQLFNLGVPRAARWFLVTDKAQVTRLPPKGRPIQ